MPVNGAKFKQERPQRRPGPWVSVEIEAAASDVVTLDENPTIQTGREAAGL
jgi:hypothetical protein